MLNCKRCNNGFEFMDADLKVHAKMHVPPPTLCPHCRLHRRCTWRNDKNFYRNTCTVCQKAIVSLYSPDKPFKVICPKCFWGDQWDPLSYGQEFDFNRPFFEQFKEMRDKVPRIAMYFTQSENSDYTAHSSRNRNCYMGSSILDSEDVHYSDFVFNSRDSLDCLFCLRIELCYECVDCQDCTNSNYLEYCSNSVDSFLSLDCRGCKRVVGCVSLRNRKNHILNQPASKEECIATIAKLKNDPAFFQEFKKKYIALRQHIPKQDAWMINAEDCTGNYLSNCKNVKYGFSCDDVEDGRFCYESTHVKDGYDITRTCGEFLYEVHGIVDLQFGKFCNLVYHSDNMAYCDNCQNCRYCFGCVSLRGHEYCILNKRYSPQAYKELVPKIIEAMKSTGEYGEFFPSELSPFGYNETKAHEHWPMERKDVLAQGLSWCDYETPIPPDIKKIPAHRLPDKITDIPNDVLNWAVECEVTGKPFKITSQELKFYRRKGLPVPRRSPLQRFRDRLALRSPMRLFERTCDNCQRPIRTPFAPERPEKVYCERCFLKAVY
ncbi:MAG: hypothetical protein V1760_02820 [Candidatus Peregrinibacteria bacterium]